MQNDDQKPRKPYKSIYKKVTNWKNLWFYQKSEVLYQLTFVFCERFLPAYGDRTVDQMVQTARSGKQNIVEGSEDGKTSTEMEAKLMNVARSSISELRQDYRISCMHGACPCGMPRILASNLCRTSHADITPSPTTSRISIRGRPKRWLIRGSPFAIRSMR